MSVVTFLLLFKNRTDELTRGFAGFFKWHPPINTFAAAVDKELVLALHVKITPLGNSCYYGECVVAEEKPLWEIPL